MAAATLPESFPYPVSKTAAFLVKFFQSLCDPYYKSVFLGTTNLKVRQYLFQTYEIILVTSKKVVNERFGK